MNERQDRSGYGRRGENERYEGGRREERRWERAWEPRDRWQSEEGRYGESPIDFGSHQQYSDPWRDYEGGSSSRSNESGRYGQYGDAGGEFGRGSSRWGSGSDESDARSSGGYPQSSRQQYGTPS